MSWTHSLVHSRLLFVYIWWLLFIAILSSFPCCRNAFLCVSCLSFAYVCIWRCALFCLHIYLINVNDIAFAYVVSFYFSHSSLFKVLYRLLPQSCMLRSHCVSLIYLPSFGLLGLLPIPKTDLMHTFLCASLWIFVRIYLQYIPRTMSVSYESSHVLHFTKSSQIAV